LGAMHRASATTAAPPWGVPEVLHLFPQLSQRFQTPAGVLSGGEQQMLALARATLGSPKLLVVDEPTEGLAPQLVKQVSQFLIALKHQGVGVLLMEQKLQMALTISDRIAVMAGGAMVFDDSRQAFVRAESQHAAWLAL
jgi:branched-chain amino acid transport system ATP-binding protein